MTRKREGGERERERVNERVSESEIKAWKLMSWLHEFVRYDNTRENSKAKDRTLSNALPYSCYVIIVEFCI